MSHRRVLVLALVAVSSSLAACAEPLTAPAAPPSAARTVASPGGGELTTCRGGWVSSSGRCR